MDNNQYRNVSDYSGNRANLRAKAIDQIKRVNAISEHIGALGDFLVTTWGGILLSLGILGIGVIIIFLTLKIADLAIIVKNIIPALLILIGLVLLALNALLTNPVQGSQLIVSIKFIYSKIHNLRDQKVRTRESWWRFWEDTDNIIETYYPKTKRHYYIALYNVRGVVSPVTFAHDLEIAAAADEDLLINNERDTVVSTVVGIDKTNVKKRPLPVNATEAMKRKRDLQYSLTSNLPNNQQITTTIIISAPTPMILRQRVTHLEAAYHRGLVVGYKRLSGQDAKSIFKEVFGEGRS